MIRHPGWSLAPIAALVVPAPAYAVQYMTAEQVLRIAYPDADAFAAAPVSLTAAQWQVIEREAPASVAAREPRRWVATSAGVAVGDLYVDEVLGKQLFISYAVAIGPDGRVQRVEILEYRETHGFEIRNARWLAQFTGKDEDSLQFGHDIKNISGATLSCRHVTEGIRRLLAIHEAQHAK
jgi:Na+-translocating ferredoxin:NAD+ oxidoreductase RnfG subunit